MQWRDSEQNSKNSSMFRLISAIRDHEGGITSNRESARHGESFLGFAHTARHVIEVRLAVNKGFYFNIYFYI